MMRPYVYIASLLVVFCSAQSVAQKDSTRTSFLPKSIRIGTDLSLIGKSFADNNLSAFEINLDTELDKYLISLDYGNQDLQSSSNDFDYTHQGTYYRAGIDVNFNHKDNYSSVLFLGFRYARSTFDEALDYSINDALFGVSSFSKKNTKVNAQWYEAVAGLKVKVWKQLFLGYTGRFKFAQKTKNSIGFTPFEIPGFGKAIKDNRFAIDYHIYYKIPFKK